MGTWAAGAFDNDGVADWFAGLQEEPRPIAVMKKSVARAAKAKPGNPIDLDDSLEAVAAAELIAAARGHGTRLPKAAANWIAEKNLKVDDALAALAAECARRVVGDSELRDEWNDNPQWTRSMNDLIERLGKPAASARASKPVAKKPRGSIDVESLTPAQAAKALGVRMAWHNMSAQGEPGGGLPNAALKEKDLRLLARCTTLRELGLYGKAITAEGLNLLAHLKLESLRISETGIKDDGGPVLEQFTGLTELHLSDSEFTDKLVPHLLRLKKLKSLDVSTSGISETGARKLAAGLPGCKVTRYE